MRLIGKKIGILFEKDFYENEIIYYKLRFPEEGAQLHFLTRLWGQERITYIGHEYQIPMECDESFEEMKDEELRSYDAIIIPSGIVSDRLRYTEDVNKLPPATEFMHRAFNDNPYIHIVGDMQGSIYAYNHCLALPMYHEMTENDQQYVIENLFNSINKL